MITKKVYRFFLAVIVTFSIPLTSYAFKVELQPKEVLPGDIFLLKVYTDNKPSANPSAEFKGRKISFFQDAADHYIALVPVDIDTSPKAYSIAVVSEEGSKTVYIKVKPYTFPTKKITLPEEKVILGPEDLKRAEREAEIMKNVLSQSTAPAWEGRFTAPMDTKVSEAFGVKRIMNGKKNSVHGGIDYKGQIGMPVNAVNSGTVVLREELFFGGNTLVIDHGMGLFSIYMHLAEFNVSKDEKVSKGQAVGRVGMTGRATGPHLHFGIKLQGVNANPLSLFELEV